MQDGKEFTLKILNYAFTLLFLHSNNCFSVLSTKYSFKNLTLTPETGKCFARKQHQETTLPLLNRIRGRNSLKIYHLFITPLSTEISKVYICQAVGRLYNSFQIPLKLLVSLQFHQQMLIHSNLVSMSFTYADSFQFVTASA